MSVEKRKEEQVKKNSNIIQLNTNDRIFSVTSTFSQLLCPKTKGTKGRKVVVVIPFHLRLGRFQASFFLGAIALEEVL
jgi:hypothetical protein